MRYAVAAVGALAAVLSPIGQVHAQEAKAFRPASAWALDYGDDYCRLMRDFSDGTETIGLFIERTQPGPMMRLIVVGDSIRLFRGAEQIGFRMSPSGAPRTAPRTRTTAVTGEQYLNLGATTFADRPASGGGRSPQMPPPYNPQEEFAAAAQVTGIALEQGLTTPVLIETGEMGAPAGALQACADDLIASWGLDAGKHKTLTRAAAPSGPTAGWIAADTIGFQDFPKLAGGNNEFRVMIDASGKPTSCKVQWPTLDEKTNQKACDALMSKGAFLPALDQSGQAMESYWTTSAFLLMPPRGRR